ncbi:hypothetical protein J7T55_014043 [Diaporthe amygdali]|uniref:uncharacterized protein n=1 Tax=Phomopsis amygdali TaxID=1214568 RepID=UPI0022FDD4A8|nr:uncharacterized protein J7T55_014043 [Diaporthe amygdali]KAJ0119838.1 hypothetical protein J7T55_014043 [Diaporthe amygdali]
MGGTTKFKFPMPHRRQRERPQEVQSISAPMTNKASKLLGAAEINIDSASPISSTSDHSRLWETHSAVSGVSGISVTISETTASGSICRSRSPLSTVKEGPDVAPSRTNARPAWEQESDIIPRDLGVSGSNAGRTHNLDTITDASSLRRRRSSSTIVSYYDKTKLPLSISQQTANSAIAKGLPDKAWELLDLDSPRPAPAPPKPERKKPTRLDLTHLLPTAGASSRRAFSKLTQKGSSLVLGPDLMTRSPSFMSSSSPASSPSECEPKPEKGLRRKLTKESLRSLRGPRPDRTSTSSSDVKSANLRKRATDTGTLYNLYQHYEDTSFRDTMSGDPSGPRPASRQGARSTEPESLAASRPGARQSVSVASAPPNKPRHHISPSLSAVTRQPYSIFPQDHGHGPMQDSPLAVTNSGLVSPPTDYAASVSSRHTRTSKASKRTDQSFTDFDPNTTSLLSLSSDSEDDDAEPPRTALSIPSVTSLDSGSSPIDSRRPSSTSPLQDPVRKQPKSKFRPSMNAQGQFLAIPENATSTSTSPPPINPRTSSLASSLASAMASSSSRPGAAPSTSTTASSVRSPSRLSQVSTSTSESIASQLSRPHPSPAHGSGARQSPEVHHIAMLQSRAAPSGHGHHELGGASENQHNSPRAHLSPRRSQPTPPISPSSMEFVIHSQHNPASDHGGPILTLSGTGTLEDERFMAVTRQEELLLAAMRAKRARMRENHQIAELAEPELDRGQDDRTASKKESLSSIKTVKATTLHPPPVSHHRVSGTASGRNSKKDATAMLFPKPPSTTSSSIRSGDAGTSPEKHEQVMLYLGSTINEAHDVVDPSSDPSSFLMDGLELFPAPASSSTVTASTPKSSHSRASSAAAATSYRTPQKAVRQARADSESTKHKTRPSSEHAYNRPDRDPGNAYRHKIAPVAERPESSSSHYDEDSQIEEQPREQQPQTRKKAARISAVGMLPEWGDDG